MTWLWCAVCQSRQSAAEGWGCGAVCAVGVNDMRNPLRPILRVMPFLPEVRSAPPPSSRSPVLFYFGCSFSL